MSLVVASNLTDPAALGADTGTWQGEYVSRLPMPKAFRLGRAVVGLCGIAPVAQALQMPGRLPVPPPHEGDRAAEPPAGSPNAVSYALETFAPAYREACENVPDGTDDPSWRGGTGLLMLDAHVFQISGGSLALVLSPDLRGTVCVGAAADYARGAVAALDAYGRSLSAELMVQRALASVSAVSTACRAPFDILTDHA